MEHELSQAFRLLAKDLPWGDEVRLVVGPLSSREAVKDEFFSYLMRREGRDQVAIPGSSIGGLSDIAKEVLRFLAPEKLKAVPLSAATRNDAIQLLAQQHLIKERAPEYAKHLKMRPMAAKLGRLLSDIDRHASHDVELFALLEAAGERDPQLAAVLATVDKLWQAGELSPWSEAYYLRAARDALADATKVPFKSAFIWGFSHFTPLEMDFIEALNRFAAVEIYEPTTREKLEVNTLWTPHSIWDEAAFLHDEIKRLIADGLTGPGRFDELAISVPQDDLYKRVVRSELHSWNVPLKDPTLPGAWREHPQWVWWRDVLSAVSAGLRLDDVRAVLGSGVTAEDREHRRKLYEYCYKRGVSGAAAQWKSLLEHCPIPELKLLVELTQILGRSFTPRELERILEEAEARDWGIDGLDFSVLKDFVVELIETRPFLTEFRARLTRYIPLFEEFLEARSRRESARSFDGVWFISHGVWLPKRVKRLIVLGGYALGDLNQASVDSLEWDGCFSAERIREKRTVAKLWDRLHSIYDEEQGRTRGFRSTAHMLSQAEEVLLSEPVYTPSGTEASRSLFVQEMLNAPQPTRSGGASATGWEKARKAELKAPELILDLQKDDVERLWKDRPLRISAFEDYLKCPFVFYARHVMNLDREQEPTLDLAGRVKGDLLHRVLERILRAELDGKVNLEGLTQDLLEEHVDEELSARSLEGLYRDAALRLKARAFASDLVRRWHSYELENRKKFPTLRPWKLEQPLEFELKPGLKFSGRADRIDSDGERFVVIDYKSGSSLLKGKDLKAGHGVQLVGYALAARNAFGLEPAGVVYLELGRKVQTTNGIFLEKYAKVFHEKRKNNSGYCDGSFDQVTEAALERWEQAAERLQAFDFSPKPLKSEDCSRCSYKDVCGFPVGLEVADAAVD